MGTGTCLQVCKIGDFEDGMKKRDKKSLINLFYSIFRIFILSVKMFILSVNILDILG